MKNSISGKVFDSCNYLLLILFSVTIIYPFWDMAVISFSAPVDSISLGLRFFPKKINFDAYIYALRDNRIIMAYIVTIYRAVAGTIVYVIFCVIAAYPLSKRQLPYRNIITVFFLIPMFFGGGLIPSFLINRSLGLMDNLLVYIIPPALNIFTVLLVRNFFMSLDKALEEAALIDGAGFITILFKVILPISMPIIATISLWSLVGQWNSWFDCLIYIRSQNKIVLQIILRELLEQSQAVPVNPQMMEFNRLNPGRQVVTKTLQGAITIITIGPIVIAYPFLQKYFVKGIMIGSLKG